jgi:hypothetical protein
MKFREAAELLGIQDPLCADETALREAFRSAGKRLHPDTGGSVEEFERLQLAQRMMIRPAERLRGWLEERDVAGDVRGSLSSELMDRFSVVAEVVQRSQSLAKESDACRSALAKALLEPRKHSIREEIAEVQQELTAIVLNRVGHFSAVASGAINGSAAWQLVRDLLFLEKWQGQLREEFGKSF